MINIQKCQSGAIQAGQGHHCDRSKNKSAPFIRAGEWMARQSAAHLFRLSEAQEDPEVGLLHGACRSQPVAISLAAPSNSFTQTAASSLLWRGSYCATSHTRCTSVPPASLSQHLQIETLSLASGLLLPESFRRAWGTDGCRRHVE